MSAEDFALVREALDELRVKLHERVSIGGLEACWDWKGPKDQKGYGMIWDRVRKRSHRAHRAAYEAWHALIPAGLTLDHLCRNRACCNPRHLEPVTNAENILRGESFSAENAIKTHCPRGHEFTPENTITTKQGWRECRMCANRQARDWKRAQRAMGNPCR